MKKPDSMVRLRVQHRLAGACLTLACAAATPAGAGPAKPAVPEGCWSVEQAEKLEQALDVFLAEGDREKRKALYLHELVPLAVGASWEDLEELRAAVPPGPAAPNDPWGAHRAYKIPSPWEKGAPRGWFRLALPKDYTPTRAWPVAVVLHGVSSDADNMLGYYLPQLTDAGFVAVFPTTLVKGQPWGAPAEMCNVYRVLDWTARRCRLDFRRMVVTGASMGGFGTWEHIFQHPEVWSAAAPVSGSGVGLHGDILSTVRGIPLYLLHGATDTVVPPDGARRTVAALKQRRIEHTYVEINDKGHALGPEPFVPLIAWLTTRPPKAFSPRPLLFPPAVQGATTLWKAHADPLGLNQKDEILDLIRGGKTQEARTLLDRADIRASRSRKNLYVLKALSYVPGLLDEFPPSLEPNDFDPARGWTEKTETLAITELSKALRAKKDNPSLARPFDSAVRRLLAKLHAKQFAVAASNGGPDWVKHYNSYVRYINDISQYGGMGQDIRDLNAAVQERIPPH